MREISLWIWDKEEEICIIRMVKDMMVIGIRIWDMDMVNYLEMMDKYYKDNGLMINTKTENTILFN